MSDKKQEKAMKTPREMVRQYSKKSPEDPNGSYTGVAASPKEKPVQDADDL